MKKNVSLYLLPFAAGVLVASCAAGGRSAAGGEVTGVGGTAWAEPTPYGMVLVSRGSMEMGPQKADSAWKLAADPKGMSVDAFWMDETEITNSKYKQFVFWVRDSIIRERLAALQPGKRFIRQVQQPRRGVSVAPSGAEPHIHARQRFFGHKAGLPRRFAKKRLPARRRVRQQPHLRILPNDAGNAHRR